MAVNIESEFMGEFDAIAGDVERMKTEAASEKQAEILSLNAQLTDVERQLELARDDGRRDGAAQAIAIVKRRLGIL